MLQPLVGVRKLEDKDTQKLIMEDKGTQVQKDTVMDIKAGYLDPRITLDQDPRVQLDQDPVAVLDQDPGAALDQNPDAALEQDPRVALDQESKSRVRSRSESSVRSGSKVNYRRDNTFPWSIESKFDFYCFYHRCKNQCFKFVVKYDENCVNVFHT